MLDREIDDMEAGRELPLEDAFRKITELRAARRNAENGMKKGRKRVQNIIPIKKSSISGRLFT